MQAHLPLKALHFPMGEFLRCDGGGGVVGRTGDVMGVES